MQQVSMKLIIKYKTCGSESEKKVQLVQVPPHHLSKDNRKAETKKGFIIIHNNEK
jgi:hypothetical protein